MTWRRMIGAAVLAGLCAVLAACLLTAGKFTSTLDLRRDGRFAFTYTGQIYLLGLSKMAQMNAQAKAAEAFTPLPCFAENGVKRACTAQETAEQRRRWQDNQRDAAEKAKRDSEGMKAMLGGIDPADPRAAEELAERLRHQAGWKRVDYKGDGLFDVDFTIGGRLDHDFQFPTIERFPMANAFVQLIRRADGTVRIDAPGYSASAGGGPFRGMLESGMAADSKDPMPSLPAIDGRFTITTDGAILANNTDDGSRATPAGQSLQWAITPRSSMPPMALVRLGG